MGEGNEGECDRPRPFSIRLRSEQTLRWPNVVGVPFQGLKLAMTFSLCNAVGALSRFPMKTGGVFLPIKKGFLRAQDMKRNFHGRNRRGAMLCAKSGSHVLVVFEAGGTHLSGLGSEGVRPRGCHLKVRD